jgi:hypothetical protein
VIKAMPVSALASLSTRLNKATKPFELIVHSPTLSLKQLPNKFMNNLTGLQNLTGLDLTAWEGVPYEALRKLFKMTSLESLGVPPTAFDFSWLRLTKLSMPTLMGSIQIKSLTNLRDLQISHLDHKDVGIIASFPLTRLHFGVNYTQDPNNGIVLTQLTKLKDLRIMAQFYPPTTLAASCTTLESLNIEITINDIDVDWISSNQRLTYFHVTGDYDDSAKFHPLTTLREISSAKFTRSAQFQLFSHLNLTRLEVCTETWDEVAKYTDLRSLSGQTLHFKDLPTTLVHLTQLTWRAIYASIITVPTYLKELSLTACSVQNLKDLTNLESLTLNQPPNFDFNAKQFAHLTKFHLGLKGAPQAVQELPKLSNLFSLRELSVTAPNNYQGVNADFLTTLTNLEMLDMAQINISLQLFTKIVHQHTILTQLRVNCSESNGEILTRLKGLQKLFFQSKQPMQGLKKKLEEVLPRLFDCQV